MAINERIITGIAADHPLLCEATCLEFDLFSGTAIFSLSLADPMLLLKSSRQPCSYELKKGPRAVGEEPSHFYIAKPLIGAVSSGRLSSSDLGLIWGITRVF